MTKLWAFVTLLRIRLGHLFNTQDVCVVETGLDVEQIWIRVLGSSFFVWERLDVLPGVYISALP